MATGIQRGKTEEGTEGADSFSLCKTTGSAVGYSNHRTLNPTATENGGTSTRPYPSCAGSRKQRQLMMIRETKRQLHNNQSVLDSLGQPTVTPSCRGRTIFILFGPSNRDLPQRCVGVMDIRVVPVGCGKSMSCESANLCRRTQSNNRAEGKPAPLFHAVAN